MSKKEVKVFFNGKQTGFVLVARSNNDNQESQQQLQNQQQQ
jgi:hypothetical protein